MLWLPTAGGFKRNNRAASRLTTVVFRPSCNLTEMHMSHDAQNHAMTVENCPTGYWVIEVLRSLPFRDVPVELWQCEHSFNECVAVLPMSLRDEMQSKNN